MGGNCCIVALHWVGYCSLAVTPKLMLKKYIPKRLQNLNRSVILAGSLAVILIIIGAGALITSRSHPKNNANSSQKVSELETAPATKGTLTIIEGTVEVKSQNDWTKAQKDQEITVGTSLRTTGASSRAEVKLEDGSVVRIDAGTEINFETLTKARIVIEQSSGYVYNRVTPQEGRTYIVHTENAQFQAAGTAFRTVNSGDEEAVEVYQSFVRETSVNLQTQEGERLAVKNRADPSKEEKIEKLDIERLKKDPFIIWNRGLDQKDDTFKNQLGFLADFEAPTIKITNPADGATIEVGENDTKGSVEISGSVEKGSKLTVQSKSISGSTPVEVTVDGSGNFTTPSIDAALGRSVFEFVATDKAGNKTTTNVSFTFNKKATAQESSITLTAQDKTDSIDFSWTLTGLSTPDGVALVYGRSSGVIYPNGTNNKKIPSGTTYTFKKPSDWKKGSTYYFKVCRYSEDNAGCDVHSNEVSVEIK